MLQLHLVGVDPQSQALLLSDRTDGRGGRFWVRVDSDLARQVARALVRPADDFDDPGWSDGEGGGAGNQAGLQRAVGGGPRSVVPEAAGPPSPDTATFEELIRTGGGYRGGLSPREIQARLRRGRTVDEVADEAGVETEWVQRFAGPILAERTAVLERASALRLVGTAGEVSALPLAEAVELNLARRGFEASRSDLAEHWSASHLEDDEWAIRFDYSDGHKAVRAEWTADLTEGRLSAGSPLSAQLAFVEGPLGGSDGGDGPPGVSGLSGS